MYNCFYRSEMTQLNIIAFAQGDVTGDRIPDSVYLTGIKSSDSPFTRNITLLVRDGRTGIFAGVPLSENAGYKPRLFLGEFTGDGAADILISIDSGGSGAIMYHYIYSFINNMPKLLFDFEVYNEEYKYEVNYLDNYRVEVVSNKNDRRYIIDISTRDKEYLNEVYDDNGKLNSPIRGFVNPLSGLYPVDFDSDGISELLAYQKIAGRYNADALGYVQNTLKWNNNSFALDNQNVAIF
jgi:hypothetical protein